MADLQAAYPHHKAPADCVVYLRLGDKATAGDITLTHESGFYDEVMLARQSFHITKVALHTFYRREWGTSPLLVNGGC